MQTECIALRSYNILCGLSVSIFVDFVGCTSFTNASINGANVFYKLILLLTLADKQTYTHLELIFGVVHHSTQS
jgi:hypothetical protein